MCDVTSCNVDRQACAQCAGPGGGGAGFGGGGGGGGGGWFRHFLGLAPAWAEEEADDEEEEVEEEEDATDGEAGAEYEVEEPDDAAEVLLSAECAISVDDASLCAMHHCVHNLVLLAQALATPMAGIALCAAVLSSLICAMATNMIAMTLCRPGG